MATHPHVVIESLEALLGNEPALTPRQRRMREARGLLHAATGILERDLAHDSIDRIESVTWRLADALMILAVEAGPNCMGADLYTGRGARLDAHGEPLPDVARLFDA